MGFNSGFKGLNTIRLATCFDPVGSSSGLHYETVNVRKLRTSLGSQQCLKKVNVKGLCSMDAKLLPYFDSS